MVFCHFSPSLGKIAWRALYWILPLSVKPVFFCYKHKLILFPGCIRHPPLSLSSRPSPPRHLHRPRQCLHCTHNQQRHVPPDRYGSNSYPRLPWSRRRHISSARPRRFHPWQVWPRWHQSPPHSLYQTSRYTSSGCNGFCHFEDEIRNGMDHCYGSSDQRRAKFC